MQERIDAELVLLRSRHLDLEYRPEGRWVKVPRYMLPAGWSVSETPVAFQIPEGFPGVPPYGFYVPAGITCGGARPDSYTEPAPTQPPFGGTWGFFSWRPEDGLWRATANPATGSNLLNWVIGFAERFREGK
jgi:hypothetical protein